ncbi:ATP17 [Sanghuangporus vaninii]
MHASLVRRSLNNLVPPKIATPKILSGGTGSTAGLGPLVDFYSKLPKGPAQPSSGIRARYFEGAKASGKPLVFTILAIFGLGYTIDYNMHLSTYKFATCYASSFLSILPEHHKNHAH